MSPRTALKVLIAALAVIVVTIGSTPVPAFAAKKIKACTLVPKAQLETAVGNAFDTPQT